MEDDFLNEIFRFKIEKNTCLSYYNFKKKKIFVRIKCGISLILMQKDVSCINWRGVYFCPSFIFESRMAFWNYAYVFKDILFLFCAMFLMFYFNV